MNTEGATPPFASSAGYLSAVEVHDRPSQQMPLGVGGVPRRTEFSPCRKYRYTLWREWSSNELLDLCQDESECCGVKAPSYLMVVGLNPSTADETKDDPTIRKCIGFAKRWGFGALCMTNLFAWRDTKPENMMKALAPEGETIDSNTSENCKWLVKIAKGAGMILAAWGKHGSYRQRGEHVQWLLEGFTMHALKSNQDGSPMHPLYVPYETVPCEFRGMRVELPKGDVTARSGRKDNAKLSA